MTSAHHSSRLLGRIKGLILCAVFGVCMLLTACSGSMNDTLATDDITHFQVSFGDISDQGHTATVQGHILLPVRHDSPAPLIIISHLRAPTCQDGSFDYPCADNLPPHRYDDGMVYLGERLAKQGYAVIIPDLSRIFIGDDIKEPYDQTQLWQMSITRFVDSLKADSDFAQQTFGTHKPNVDLDRIGLFVHSRSALMVATAHQMFGSRLKGVLAYGPSYDTYDLAEISPKPVDVPYLAVVGSGDVDVGASANLWLGVHADQPYRQPISVVELPNFGHMYINRTTSRASIDDRIGCDVMDCPNATAHEQLIGDVATDWFALTLQQQPSTLPTSAHHTLPKTVANYPARWLALTPQRKAHIGVDDFYHTDPNAKDGKNSKGTPIKACTHSDPMNPTPNPSACPEPKLGIVQTLAPVIHAKDAHADTSVQDAHGLSLHLSPTGSEQGVSGTAVQLTLHMANQKSHHISIPATEPALASRLSTHDNGIYRIGTVRIALPRHITDGTITGISIHADRAVEIRGVDFW